MIFLLHKETMEENYSLEKVAAKCLREKEEENLPTGSPSPADNSKSKTHRPHNRYTPGLIEYNVCSANTSQPLLLCLKHLKMPITDPENKIRDMRRMKRLVNGA